MELFAKKYHVISTDKGGIISVYTLNDHMLQAHADIWGVTLSKYLTFDAHVGNITKKGGRMLGFMQRTPKGSL